MQIDVLDLEGDYFEAEESAVFQSPKHNGNFRTMRSLLLNDMKESLKYLRERTGCY